ncbi:MAG: 4-hydroxythreonine-4-phosphate dehydrogenase PdxA [Bacteroidota bacterium]
MKPIIGVTMGDFNGIGPEVTLKALLSPEVQRCCKPVIIGSIDVYEWYARRFRMKLLFREIDQIPRIFQSGVTHVFPIEQYRMPSIRPGMASRESGDYAVEAIKKTTDFCQRGILDAMVTAPVSKAAIDSAGYHFPGQTEMLTKFTSSRNVMMVLIAENSRVGLATVHIPVKDVAKSISIQKIREKISILQSSLKRDFRIMKPRIAVLGLNPHGGENGLLGKEEMGKIIPAIKKFNKQNCIIDGPFPADGFFGSRMFINYDAILAMYHDQGLIPLKLIGFDKGVNYSAGLKIIRTSPDHGTGISIAGKGIANAGSMIEAIKLAAKIFRNRTISKI